MYFLYKKNRLGTILCRCGKKLGGLRDVQEKNTPMTIEKGSHVIRAVVQPRIVEQTRRGNRHGSSSDQQCWALLRDARPFLKMHKKRKRWPSKKKWREDLLKRLGRSFGKNDDYGQQMILSGHTKAELQSWDTQMREGPDDDAEHHQPRQWNSAGHTLPVKQHPAYHVAVKIVKETWTTENNGEKPQLGREESTPIFFIVVSMGWLEDEFVVAQIVSTERKNSTSASGL